MGYCYFPAREAELKVDIKYETLHEGQTVEAGSAKITTILMNLSAINFGYKIEDQSKSFFSREIMNRYIIFLHRINIFTRNMGSLFRKEIKLL
jgi:hypothetical protein